MGFPRLHSRRQVGSKVPKNFWIWHLTEYFLLLYWLNFYFIENLMCAMSYAKHLK